MSSNWIAADWGATNLRVWLIGPDGDVLAKASAPAGIAQLENDGFEPALQELIGPWLGTAPLPIITCGAISSRQGWHELPLTYAPCSTDARMTEIKTNDARYRVILIAGVAQQEPADVMHGAETQIAGLLEQNPKFDGVACIVGAETKWVRISAGEICNFQSIMTGEMFDALSKHSLLRHSVGTAADWDQAAFDASFEAVFDRPQLFATRMMPLYAGPMVSDDYPAARVRAELTGALMGIELAAAKPYWLGQNVSIFGESRMVDLYARVLGQQGVQVTIEDSDVLLLAGLKKAHQTWLTEAA